MSYKNIPHLQAVLDELHAEVERKYTAHVNTTYRPGRWGRHAVPTLWLFARDLGKKSSVVRASMRGNPTIGTFLQMCKVLGVRPSELFARAEQPEQKSSPAAHQPPDMEADIDALLGKVHEAIADVRKLRARHRSRQK